METINGYTVITSVPIHDDPAFRTVLAVQHRGDITSYVTAVARNQPGETEWVWGHYFDSLSLADQVRKLAAAVEDLAERSGIDLA